MRVVFTGTGTSQGVPVIGCECVVCTSADNKDKRLRTSVWVEEKDVSLVIDTGPDFRYQMLRSGVKKLDAVLFTHSHKDHIAGLDDVRAYNYFQNKPMDVYAMDETIDALKREYAYIFENAGYPGIPRLNIHPVRAGQPFLVGDVEVCPFRVLHYQMEVLGFRIGGFTYITDANYIAPEEIDEIRGSEVLVLNALRPQHHVSHYSLPEAVEVAEKVGAKQTYLTHLSHQMGLHEQVSRQLPPNIFLAWDCLSIEI